MPCDQKSPGPADFKLKPLVGFKGHDVDSTKRRGPEWTMAGRTMVGKSGKTPGPIDVGPFNRFGKYPTVGGVMIGKHKGFKMEVAPGPADYKAIPSTMYRWPYDSKFTMGVKTKMASLNVGPGPASEVTPLDVYKNRSPKYPMFAKISNFKEGKSPGPNNYDKAGESKSKTMNRSPAYSMRPRLLGTPSASKRRGPGPADYSLMDYNPFSRSPTHHIAGKSSRCVGVYVLPQDNC